MVQSRRGHWHGKEFSGSAVGCKPTWKGGKRGNTEGKGEERPEENYRSLERTRQVLAILAFSEGERGHGKK